MKELRQSTEYTNSPIVCISAHVFPADRENAFNSGADEFLPRPIYNEELLASLIISATKSSRDKFDSFVKTTGALNER